MLSPLPLHLHCGASFFSSLPILLDSSLLLLDSSLLLYTISLPYPLESSLLVLLDSSLLLYPCKEYKYRKWWNIFLERRCTKIIINNKDQPRATTVERTFLPPCWLSSLILLPSFCMPKGSLFLLDSSLLLCKEYEYSKWWNIFLDVSKIIINNKDQPKTTTNVPFLLADVRSSLILLPSFGMCSSFLILCH